MTTWIYSGVRQTYIVPSGASRIRVECWGAGGSGKGGYASGEVAVTSGQVLYVRVGGSPTNNGWNGGGAGPGAVAGGGASDVRQVGDALTDRLVVAGGGGGDGTAGTGGAGGAGGGLTGSAGLPSPGYEGTPGQGGTQTAGGAGGFTAGSLGDGGGGGYYGGGGGGGYYGGGGGAGAGGGGGSSLVPAGGTTTAGVQSGNGQVIITVLNVAPNAPTLTAPVGNVTIDRTSTQRFSWTVSDPDAGDSQSKYDLQYRLVGAGSWTAVTGTTPNQFRDFAAATFAAGDYEWQVRTYDAAGVVGPYSASAFFTAATQPDGPTITDPINGSTISAEDYTLVWSVPDQDAYQVRKVADASGSPDTSTVYSDSGTVESAASRSRSLTFPVNNRTEHLQLRVRFDGLWSTWASVSVAVSYTQPAIPTVTVDENNPAGAISVQAAHPTPVDQPAVAYVDIWRRHQSSAGWDPDQGGETGIRVAALLDPTAIYVDWMVAHQGEYAYRARAMGDSGTSSWSVWVDDGTGTIP